MARNLSPDEAALWARVMASARPLRAVAPTRHAAPTRAEFAEALSPQIASRKGKGSPPAVPRPVAVPELRVRPTPPRTPANTLDGGWDKRLTRGTVSPDVTIDLHGHTLRSAHDLLDAALARAIADGDRVVLLVTGRPPRAESERPHARGAIRAAVGDWLAASRHSRHIAAVRGAHPRHGGAGALYLILKRARDAKS